jgi:hypothetical protein
VREPSRTHRSSSPAAPPAVNAEPARRPPITLRRFIRIERGIRHYHPRFPEPPPKPIQADQVLAALAAAHSPGDPIGLREIRAAAGVPEGVGSAVRKWARSEGLWPYNDRPNGFTVAAARDGDDFYCWDSPGLVAWKRRQEGGEP